MGIGETPIATCSKVMRDAQAALRLTNRIQFGVDVIRARGGNTLSTSRRAGGVNGNIVADIRHWHAAVAPERIGHGTVCIRSGGLGIRMRPLCWWLMVVGALLTSYSSSILK